MWTNFNAKCIPSWEDKDLWVKVKSAYINNQDIQGKWSPQLDFDLPDVPANLKKAPLFHYDKQGNPKKMLCNVLSFMKLEDNPLEDRLRYNLFTKNIEFKTKAPWHYNEGQSWNDEDAIHYKAWLSDAKNFEMQTSVIHEAALNMAKENAYHPVYNYLEGLEWDGKKRLGNWLSEYCSCDENIYTRAIGEKVLVAAVARIYKPGTKFDHILVIEGKQGIGKSTLVSIMGKYWFGDIMIDPHNKDTVESLRGKWVVEISEMECAKREVNALKRFITCTSDRMRPAYARTAQDFPRQCIFIGTINPEHGRGYLKDPTGNRRYWPLKVEDVDFLKLRQDMDQIWAEALQVYKSGKCKLYLETKELQDFANKEAEERFEEDPMEEIIGNYLEAKNVEYITTTDIMQNCLMMPVSKLDKFFGMRLACAMNRIGYRNRTKRIEGRVQRCYVREQENEFVDNKESPIGEKNPLLIPPQNQELVDIGIESTDTSPMSMDI
jgi:putative DNA primase/helicase